MKKIVIAVFVIAIVSACKQSKSLSQGNNGKANFNRLFEYMQGEFSSELQSQNDSDYFDIRLRMLPVMSKSDSVFYLYVEQAMAGSEAKPYRQRFYKVVMEDATHFTSHIYTISNPLRFAGKAANDPIFKPITPDSLQLKDGCAVHLTYLSEQNLFSGATGEGSCPSERSGAAYATAKVTLNATQLQSWDQGWNKEGKQVWGATKGGYIFIKKK